MLALSALIALLSSADPENAYEQQLIEWGLAQNSLELEPEPEGKVVEEVFIAREDIFSETDPVPTWLNVFHGRTKEYVVSREVLLEVGQSWDKARAIETERNLRTRLNVLAVARVVAVKGKNGGVAVLVVTKDRWSLRLNWNYSIVGNVIEYLNVPLTEVNVLGHAIEVTLNPFLRPDTLSLGQEVTVPRLAGTNLYMSEQASLIFNRQTWKLEGTVGLVQVARPLYQLDQHWGFNTFVTWDTRRVRVFRGNQVRLVTDPDTLTKVPYVYDARNVDFAALVTRRFGTEWKADVTGGLAGYTHQSSPPAEQVLDPQVQQWFVSNYLPRSENAAYLYGFVQFFRAKYAVQYNVETFGLSEDFQLGPRLLAGFKAAFPTPWSQSFGEVGAALRWRFLFHEDLLSLQVAAGARITTDADPVNQQYAFEVLNFSPPFEGGRFVTRVQGFFRQRDLNNRQFLLGGGTGLRGAGSGEFIGRNLLLANVEYRTRYFRLTTLHAGFVLFYDVGSVYDTGRPDFTHTVGMGLRVLIPQLNQQVIRLDVGFVLGGSDSGFSADRISSTFGQVTQIRPDFFDDPI